MILNVKKNANDIKRSYQNIQANFQNIQANFINYILNMCIAIATKNIKNANLTEKFTTDDMGILNVQDVKLTNNLNRQL
jgi:hypothetical protein